MSLLNPTEDDLKRILWCWILRRHLRVFMAGGLPPYWKCHRCEKRLPPPREPP